MNIPSRITKQVLASLKVVLANTILEISFYTSTKIMLQIMIKFDY